MHIQPIKPNKAESQKELIAYCPSLIPFSASRHPLRIVQLAIKEDSAPLSPSSNRPVRNAARPAPPLLVLISFFTGMLTEKSYYKILIKQCPQTEHKRYQMFAAYWDSGVNTILKTSNFGQHPRVLAEKYHESSPLQILADTKNSRRQGLQKENSNYGIYLLHNPLLSIEHFRV